MPHDPKRLSVLRMQHDVLKVFIGALILAVEFDCHVCTGQGASQGSLVLRRLASAFAIVVFPVSFAFNNAVARFDGGEIRLEKWGEQIEGFLRLPGIQEIEPLSGERNRLRLSRMKRNGLRSLSMCALR